MSRLRKLAGRDKKESLMDKELKQRIGDYFESWELAEFLRIPVEDFIEAFEDEIEEALDDVEELMNVKH